MTQFRAARWQTHGAPVPGLVAVSASYRPLPAPVAATLHLAWFPVPGTRLAEGAITVCAAACRRQPGLAGR
jgi:hypothetical protein